jgi:hypothetical protein
MTVEDAKRLLKAYQARGHSITHDEAIEELLDDAEEEGSCEFGTASKHLLLLQLVCWVAELRDAERAATPTRRAG